MTIVQWIEKMLPVLLSKSVSRMDGETKEGTVTAYWAGSVLRIDLKP